MLRRRGWLVAAWLGATAVAIIGTLAVLASVVAPTAGSRRIFEPLPDTAGTAVGGAERLTTTLRQLGFACSDEGVDPKMISRQCGRSRFLERMVVTFAGDAASGDVLRMRASLNQPFDSDLTNQVAPHVIDAVLGATTMDDTTRIVIRKGLFAPASRRIDVVRWFFDAYTFGDFDLVADAFRSTGMLPAVLSGSHPEMIEWLRPRGYDCAVDSADWIMKCERTRGGDAYRVSVRNSDGRLTGLTLQVSSNDERSQRAWNVEWLFLLDNMRTARTETIASWFRVNDRLAGADAYVAGMDLEFRTRADDDDTYGSLETTCWRSEDQWHLC